MPDINRLLVDEYRNAGLGERILAVLEAHGVDTDHLSQEILAELDHIHGGGYPNTIEHAAMVEMRPGMRVLDIGCGIGGPARYFARAFGCRVSGIDISPDYIDAATMLTERCGLTDLVDFRCGDALGLNFDDATFDVVWCLNVSMNIPDRDRLYAEMARVLKPGGQLALSELGQGPGGAPYYPLSWASSADCSFLVTPDKLRAGLEAAGFRIRHWIDEAARRRETGGLKGRGANILPPGEAMRIVRTEDYPERQANGAKSVNENRLTNVRLVAVLEQ